MALSHTPRCDCCGLFITAQGGQKCSRCGYPVLPAQEIQFLETAVHDLQRVAAFGGANVTVAQLISRYQFRLRQLQASSKTFVETNVQPSQALPKKSITLPLPVAIDQQFTGEKSVVPQQSFSLSPVAAAVNSETDNYPPHVQSATHVFSMKSFVADHTINIVASIGAFLILTGALSFVATTTNLLLSFLAMFFVHGIFGAVGSITYRFRNLHIISVIYTAIFALLVPLVGFSCYRLVVGQVLSLSPPAMIAIAAIYAAFIYVTLAIYQQFRPFSYFAAVALIVADLASASALHLGLWWWPVALMLLAFPLLLFLEKYQVLFKSFVGSLEILRNATQILLWGIVSIGGLGCVLNLLFAFNDAIKIDYNAVHWATTCFALLLFAWFGLLAWLRKSLFWTYFLPYTWLFFTATFLYAYNFQPLGYACAATITAWVYCLFASFVLRGPSSRLLRYHMVFPGLVLIGIVPFIIAPLIPFDVLFDALTRVFNVTLPGDAPWKMVLLVAGGLLALFVAGSFAGWQKVPAAAQRGWCWLLLCAGVLFEWAYSMLVLSVHGNSAWFFLGLTLVLVTLAVVVRLRTSPAWAQPLDVLALCAMGQSFVLSLGQSSDFSASVLLGFVLLTYGCAVYQKRFYILWLPCVFAVLAMSFLWTRPLVVFALGAGLPLLAALLLRSGALRWPATAPSSAKTLLSVTWEWPLLLIGFLYGLCFAGRSMLFVMGINTVSLPLSFSPAWWIAALACLWYGSAVIARTRWWLVGSMTFAVLALCFPKDQFSVLVYAAPVLMLFGFCVQRVSAKSWALPLYSSAILAAVLAGVTAYIGGHMAVAVWGLLVFALVLYLLGVVQDEDIWLGGAAVFACWSLLNVSLLGNAPRLLWVALLCAVLGCGIRCWELVAAYVRPYWSARSANWSRPLYVVATVAALLQVIDGSSVAMARSFTTTFTSLLLYAVLTYVILLFERKPAWTWMTTGFVLWAVFLVMQDVPCSNTGALVCHLQGISTLSYLAGIVFGTGCLGMLAGRFVRGTRVNENSKSVRFAWGGAWYVSAFVTLCVAVGWGYAEKSLLPALLVLGMLLAFTAFSLLIMFVERVPEIITVAVALAALTIWQSPLPVWQQVLAFDLLFFATFCAQFIWRYIPPSQHLSDVRSFYAWLSWIGQGLVVLSTILYGGLAVGAGRMAQVGAFSLGILAVLLYWHGRLRSEPALRRSCTYGAGMLLSLVPAWLIAVFLPGHVDWITMVPATYLVVIAPFLLRDDSWSLAQNLGRASSVLGAVLLLLPTLWLSFNQSSLQPTLILTIEAIALLLLGLVTHTRLFVLSGITLVIVSVIHALFLPSLGLPLSLALVLMGACLLSIATGLSLARHRLIALWTQLE